MSVLVLASFVVGCTGSEPTPGPSTPEEVVATARDGDHVDVAGTVFTLTFASRQRGPADEDGGDAWELVDGRWLLLRTEVPNGVQHSELSASDLTNPAMVARGWGLGVALADDAPRPRIGDTVTVSGTFRTVEWSGFTVPVVEPDTIDAPSHGLGVAGACATDDDCEEHLVCTRAGACAPPEDTNWGSLWRDVDGHCYADDDCPRGQVCDTSFVVPDSGDYTWRYHGGSKQGASLCVPEHPTLEQACPVVWSTADLGGGRFTQGRELCVRGVVQSTLAAQDGDTHLQLVVDEPLPYPTMDAHIWLFGATTEIGPPHKNPDRPQGAVVDPPVGAEIVTLGTYRWDGGHGWFEQHPVKAWWPAP